MGVTNENETVLTNNVQRDPTPWPWVLPLLVYLVLLNFDPEVGVEMETAAAADPTSLVAQELPRPTGSNEKSATGAPDKSDDGVLAYDIDYGANNRYLAMTIIRLVVAGGLLLYWFREYTSQFKFRVGWRWLPVGIGGAIAWIGICHFQLESRFLVALGFSETALGARTAFNPMDGFETRILLVLFMVARFGVLVAAVPLAEEIFLRGFLMRYVQQADWWKADLGKLKWLALLVGPAYGALTHPSEMIAAIVWFSLVTWLMVKTRSIWECVFAHAVTNLLLGVYVVQFSQWQLW
jgi:CAAX prenyl protease-like protein